VLLCLVVCCGVRTPVGSWGLFQKSGSERNESETRAKRDETRATRERNESETRAGWGLLSAVRASGVLGCAAWLFTTAYGDA
jgi:hypothetical protein